MKIKNYLHLKNIIQDPQVSYISFRIFRKVEVKKMENLKYLFPLYVANSPGQLQTTKRNNCSQLKKKNPSNTSIKHTSTLKFKESMCISLQLLDISFLYCPIVTYREIWLYFLFQVLLIDLPQLKGADVNEIILTQSSLHKFEVNNFQQIFYYFGYLFFYILLFIY